MKEIFKAEKRSRIVFHFNKAHIQDPTIPTWVVKHKGKTHYVNHLTYEPTAGKFDTKETPDSNHTKGSIQFKALLTIEETDGQTTATIH